MTHRVPAAILFGLVCLAQGPAAAAQLPIPVARDPRLVIQLFAAAPDIVTPIGMCVDRQHRLFVVESHTHSPDAGYPGPRFDRIKILRDTNGDGRADDTRVFADGLTDAMNLALSPDGVLYVCHRAGVTVLEDRDEDGVSESRRRILSLETDQTYDHSGLLGLAFAPGGGLVVSRGNVAGYPYRIVGSDGSAVAGYGDGGHVIACGADGSHVRVLATGFWNPFGLVFDKHGRLFATDNDPDSRGPNRLVHLIEGGDFGFKALYGPSGLHSYNAWNGELPGTLPMVAATGESPSGILDAERARLPDDYRETLLVASWGTHRIERFRLSPNGHSFTAGAATWVQGSDAFRPVAIAAGPDGAIYVSDWVRKDYPNHGEGRIWRITTRPGADTRAPRPPWTEPRAAHADGELLRLASLDAPSDFDDLMVAATSDDAFRQTAARRALARPVFHTPVRTALGDPRSSRRLAAMLALRDSDPGIPPESLPALLRDADAAVRMMALMEIGRQRRVSLRDDLETAIRPADTTAELLSVYLDTCQALSPELVAHVEMQTPGFRIPRRVEPALIRSLLTDHTLAPEAAAMVVARVAEPDQYGLLDALIPLVDHHVMAVRREAARALAFSQAREAAEVLERIARDGALDPELRADAVAGLARREQAPPVALADLAGDPVAAVRLEIARAARKAPATPEFAEILAQWNRTLPRDDRAPLRQHVDLALGLDERRPRTEAQWLEAVADGGDAEAGRRLFLDEAMQCIGCHRLHGRGGLLGPDLTVIGRSAGRRELARSILFPSEEIAPEYQAHTVYAADGRVFSGIQFHFRDGGKSISMMVDDGREIRVPLDDIDEYKALRHSLMPEALVKLMTVSDVRNLLAFLQSLK